MGKGVITSVVGGGRYVVREKFDDAAAIARLDVLATEIAKADVDLEELARQIRAVDAELSALIALQNTEIDNLNAAIAAEDQAGVIAARAAIGKLQIGIAEGGNLKRVLRDREDSTKARRVSLASERDAIIEQTFRDIVATAWSADSTDTLAVGTEVGLIDVGRESGFDQVGHLIIQPNVRRGAGYSVARDGLRRRAIASSPSGVVLNIARLPGATVWSERYRTGVLQAVNQPASRCTVLLDPLLDSAKLLGTASLKGLYPGKRTTYSNVPIEYEDCNGEVFQAGDRVVVEFNDDGSGFRLSPVVIGFVSNPRPCEEREFLGIIFDVSRGLVELNEAVNQPMQVYTLTQFHSQGYVVVDAENSARASTDPDFPGVTIYEPAGTFIRPGVDFTIDDLRGRRFKLKDVRGLSVGPFSNNKEAVLDFTGLQLVKGPTTQGFSERTSWYQASVSQATWGGSSTVVTQLAWVRYREMFDFRIVGTRGFVPEALLSASISLFIDEVNPVSTPAPLLQTLEPRKSYRFRVLVTEPGQIGPSGVPLRVGNYVAVFMEDWGQHYAETGGAAGTIPQTIAVPIGLLISSSNLQPQTSYHVPGETYRIVPVWQLTVGFSGVGFSLDSYGLTYDDIANPQFTDASDMFSKTILGLRSGRSVTLPAAPTVTQTGGRLDFNVFGGMVPGETRWIATAGSVFFPGFAAVDPVRGPIGLVPDITGWIREDSAPPFTPGGAVREGFAVA